MNSLRLLAWCLVLAAVAAWLPSPARAIPVFARKYGFECTMCHANFPRLNDFGVRFRQNGYQLPGKVNEEKTVLESPPPIAFRTSVGYNSDQFENVPDAEDVNQFQVNGLDVLSAGVLGRNIGYLLVWLPQIEGSQGVAPQTGTLEMANVIFNNVGGSRWLDVRVGRFEPAYDAFSSARRLSVAPYEVYDVSFPGGVLFSETQTGIELSGNGRSGLSYAAGLVDGASSNTTDDSPQDVYVRVAKVFGRGEGQTRGQRLGVTGYFGQARSEVAPTGSRQDFNRMAADASLNFDHLNLGLQYLTASDDGTLWGVGEDVDYHGGFAQVLYLPSVSFVGYARYGWVNLPAILDAGDITRWTLGGRYYPIDNLAFQLEYSQLSQDAVVLGVGDATEKFLTARIDYAF